MSSNDTIIRAQGVTKTYNTGKVIVNALRGVNLEVKRGEMVSIMGPSGCGKTTLLNTLSGLDSIDGGSIEIDGRELVKMSDRERTSYRAANMGFVFQFYNLLPVLSAVENVEMPLLLDTSQRIKPRQARQLALEALDAVGLSGQANQVPAELSGGQRQRVTIARAHRLGRRADRRPRFGDLAGHHRPDAPAEPGEQPDLRPGHSLRRNRPTDRPHRLDA
jgi:putative ABC transport system ATP-binding protein